MPSVITSYSIHYTKLYEIPEPEVYGVITFYLKIENPLEGKIAAIFDLLAKNAKNANLRITGTLLSPKGEFRFF